MHFQHSAVSIGTVDSCRSMFHFAVWEDFAVCWCGQLGSEGLLRLTAWENVATATHPNRKGLLAYAKLRDGFPADGRAVSRVSGCMHAFRPTWHACKRQPRPSASEVAGQSLAFRAHG